MKDAKLIYSLDNSNPVEVYKIKLALRLKKTAYENTQWHNNVVGEREFTNYLLMTYQQPLIAQQKTILDLSVPLFTWVNNDGTLDIRIGLQDIVGVL